MSWDSLTLDTQGVILAHALRPTGAAKVCLCDHYCYSEHTQELCVGFLDVVGTWLSDGSFACNLDRKSVPKWKKDSAVWALQTWMQFNLRVKRNGQLVLPDGHDDGKWITVGRFQEVSVPVSGWHGVMKQALTTTNRYNCRFYSDVTVHHGDDEECYPGYSLRVCRPECVTHDAGDAYKPFDVAFTPDAPFLKNTDE